MIAPGDQDRYTQLLQKALPGCRLLRAWPLAGGISATTTAIEFERPGGKRDRAVVRHQSERSLSQNPRWAHVERALILGLRHHGIPVPFVYAHDDALEIFSTPCLILEYVEGDPPFAPADRAGFVLQFASTLAHIHELPRDMVERSNLAPLPSLARAAGAPADTQALFDQRLMSIWTADWPLSSRNAPALLHGDYWPGNVLWRDGQLRAVIDWEDAAWGDPLADLAISRLDLLCLFGVEAMRDFTAHYQALQPLDYADLPRWDLYAALRLARLAGSDLAAWAAFFHPLGRPDITAQTLRAHWSHFVDEALAGIQT